ARIVERGQALVRLGVVPSASGLVTQAMSTYGPVVHGQLAAELRDQPSSVLVDELREGQIDLAVVAITDPPSGLEVTELFDDPLVLVLPRDHALASSSAIGWRQLAHERLAMFVSGSVSTLAGAQFARMDHE